MAEQLTLQQQQAVDNRGGKLLVSAAAGSGKTKVLVDRLLKYINNPADPANIDDFLIITYTKAAAAELRGKIAAKLSEHIAADPANMHLQRQLQRLYLTKISTVHAFCADILREYAYMLDISADFRVADENECLQLRQKAMDLILEQAYAKIGEHPDLQAFVDNQGLGRNDALVPEIIEAVYDSAACHLDPNQWLRSCIDNVEISADCDPSLTVWGKYLLEDLHRYLDLQINAMQTCVNMIAAMEGHEKPLALLSETVNALHHLRASTTWEEVVQRKNIDFGRLTFPKKFDDPFVSTPIKAVRKACKDGLEKKLRNFADGPLQVMEDLQQSITSARGLISLVESFGAAFGRLKRSRRILDFSDLEHRTLDLLVGKHRSGPTAAAREIGSRFREIMVDEYQDSNSVQDAIFEALSRKRQNLFMVGDVKQSIYQFRLADPSIFLEKYANYAHAADAEAGEGRKILLSSNFRSSGGVIDAVNDVFQDCMSNEVGGLIYGDDEILREGIAHIPLNEPEVELHAIDVAEDTYEEEAAFVADRINTLLDGKHYVRDKDNLRPIIAEDIVILLRSPGSVGMHFQEALRKRGIRCESGGGTDLLRTREVETLHSLLQVISNPRQDIPLLAVLASPVFGFTADELASIRGKNRYCSIYDAMLRSGDPKAEGFLKQLSQLREAAALATLPELLETIDRITHFKSIFAAMDNGEIRYANIQSFCQVADAYTTSGSKHLQMFLDYLETMQEKGIITSSEASAGSVTIMSIHKSKGLEFPVVFLCGLSRRFNRESLNAQVLCNRELGLGLSCVDTRNRVRYPAISKRAISAKLASESLSEELRVLYVAMTRARDRLIMTYASQSLEKDLTEIASRMDISGKLLMTCEVSCPGEWVLYSALKRTEAGALFALGGKPNSTAIHDSVWKIAVQSVVVHEDAVDVSEAEEKPQIDNSIIQKMHDALTFCYPHTLATATPSKQTPTQRKGRVKDQEAAEHTQEAQRRVHIWRKPEFVQKTLRGKDVGSAVHTVMRRIQYNRCTEAAGVQQEVQRLVCERFITQEQADAVDCNKIAAFFNTPFGAKLISADHIVREFKFSIMEDAGTVSGELHGEKILLQGVVDCAVIEEDGITIIDFKTDRVTNDTLQSVARGYMQQVASYADAMSRIYQLPIKAKALYFFHLNEFVWL